MKVRPVIWASTGLYILFLIAATFIQNRVLMEALRAFLLASSIAVCVAYAKPAIQAMFAHKRPDLVEQLTLGIALAWLTTAVQSGWYMIWRLAGQPVWMVNTDFSAFLVYSLGLAAVLHITAPGAIDGTIPKRNMVMLGIALGGAVMIVSTIILINPDIRSAVEWLRPYMSDENDVRDALIPRRGMELNPPGAE